MGWGQFSRCANSTCIDSCLFHRAPWTCAAISIWHFPDIPILDQNVCFSFSHKPHWKTALQSFVFVLKANLLSAKTFQAAALLAGYCFSLVGRVCILTGAKSYKEAWMKSIGPESGWVPSAFVAFKTFVACLVYSIILGDLIRDLAKSAGATVCCQIRNVLRYMLLNVFENASSIHGTASLSRYLTSYICSRSSLCMTRCTFSIES